MEYENAKATSWELDTRDNYKFLRWGMTTIHDKYNFIAGDWETSMFFSHLFHYNLQRIEPCNVDLECPQHVSRWMKINFLGLAK